MSNVEERFPGRRAVFSHLSGVIPFLCFWLFVANPSLLSCLLRTFGFRLCRYYLDMHVIEMGTPPLVKTAARLFRELCYSNKSQLMAGIICAGWDSAKGGQVRARLFDCGRVEP